MDKFRRKQQHNCDVGGIHCDCCNRFHSKDKYMLNKMSRKQLKEEDFKNIEKIEVTIYNGKAYELSYDEGEDDFIREQRNLDKENEANLRSLKDNETSMYIRHTCPSCKDDSAGSGGGCSCRCRRHN